MLKHEEPLMPTPRELVVDTQRSHNFRRQPIWVVLDARIRNVHDPLACRRQPIFAATGPAPSPEGQGGAIDYLLR